MAMPVQMQQMPQGEFAAAAAAMATPQGKKGPAEPGLTPGAKRPLDRSTFIRQTAGIPKPMDMQELNAGFHNLMALQAQDEGFATSISGCVHFNACLLNDAVAKIEQLENAMIARVGKMEADISSQHKGLEKQNMSSNIMQAAVEQLSAKIGQSLDFVDDQCKAADARLRSELDAFTVKIENKLFEMRGGPGSVPIPPPGIATGALDTMNNNVAAIGKGLDQMAVRVGDIEMKQGFTTASVQEMQGGLSALRVEVQQVVQQTGHIMGSAGQSSSAAAAATAAAASAPTSQFFDPWAGAAFGQQFGQQPAQQQQQQQQQQQPPAPPTAAAAAAAADLLLYWFAGWWGA